MRKTHALAAGVALVFLLFRSATPGNAAEQKPTAAPASAATKAVAPEPAAPPPPVAIPLADIATRATEVSNLLGNLTASAVPSAQIESIAKSLPESSEKLNAHFATTTKSLESEPTLETLQTLQQDWQRRQAEATGWLSVLTTQATKLQEALNQLGDLQKTWTSTRASAPEAKAPGPILQQIDDTLTAIAAAQAKIQSQRTALLDLQSRVAQGVTLCATLLAQIGQIQQKSVAGIFVPDALPIWRVDIWADALKALPEHVREVGIARGSDIVAYVFEPRDGSALHAAIFVILALAFFAARRKVDGWKKTGAPVSPVLSVFERPYAAALAVVLVLVTSPFFQMPTTVRQFLTILALAPLIRLARPMVSASIASVIYVICLLFAVDTLRQAFTGVQVIGQAILVSETLAAIIVLLWTRRHYRQIIAGRAESSRLILLKLVRFLLIIVLIFSLLAGAAGYVRLARLLTPGILVGGVLALAAYAYLRIGAGVVALAFRVWPLRLLQMVEHHREFLARRAYILLVWMAVFGWSARYLAYLGLLDPARRLIQSVLTAKVERGTISISFGDILEFFLVVWVAYLLSRFLRFALQEDIYPRIDLAPGQSYAASSLLNYIILALGVVAALGVLGVDFAKVSLVAGAFSVGIGFGLQSVVNNFVSGLILLFERPIKVGDAVQVGSVQGRVIRIGMRASIVHTFQGAEIIVPNAQLISQEVTNWTRSDQLRRVDLPVGVSYGTAPKKAMDLLESVARAHPRVLQHPAPQALFIGYGDNSINFELRAWTEFVDSVQVRSDLTIAIYDAVYAAGLSFPFPQREVRLLSDQGAGGTTAAVQVVKKE